MLDLTKAKFYSVSERHSKYSLSKKYMWEEDQVIDRLNNSNHVIVLMGAHLIKCGLSKYLIKLMRTGKVSHVAMNGAASIHDFEIAAFGHTSECVGETLRDGRFGMWEETGRMINQALNGELKLRDRKYVKSVKEERQLYGETMKMLCCKQTHRLNSILSECYYQNIPVTVHVALGTDIIHQHPDCNGENIGRMTYNDFKLLAEECTRLTEKSVVLCFGSAVIMPEVFVKALNLARNISGNPIGDFSNIVVDMNIQYRELENVVKRPTKRGIYYQARFEHVLPILAKKVQSGRS